MAQTTTPPRQNDASKDTAAHMMDRLAATNEETLDRVAEDATDARHAMHAATASASVAARRAQDRLVEAAGKGLHKTRSAMGRNPLTAIGIAFAVGVLLTAWIRR